MDPRCEEFLQVVQDLTKNKVLQWWDTVTNMMGTQSESTNEWNQIFQTQITELYDEMINEAVSKRDFMLNRIEQLLQKSSVLCKDLNIKMPDYGSEELTLFEEQEYLANKVKEYEDKIDSIQREIKKLNKQELSLCDSLGHKSNPLPTQPLPAKDVIVTFKNYLEELESKKFEREEQFLNIKSEIMVLVNELKYKPSLDFERMVVSPDDSLFMVTDNNMEKLNDFLKSLKKHYEDTKEEILNIREKLKSIWELLNEDLCARDSFLENHKGYDIETLASLKQEMKRCENLKKANIEVFVQRLRKELVAMWDKCHVSEKERADFIYFNSDTYSEDLLTIHDLEISKMKEFYNANIDLFQLLEKRSELWARMLELEESASQPGRFKNRGGQLLKEEKERNVLAKRLPKIEDQLLHLANTFAAKYGRVFCSWGKPVSDIIAEDHQTHEEDKKFKLSIRKRKRDLTPCKQVFGTTSSVSTQNLAITPKSGVKRALLTPCENIRTAPPKLTLNGRSQYSIERAKRIEKCRRISQRMQQKKQQKENTLTEYDMFEQDLGNKEGCRSTLFGGTSETNNCLAVPLPVTPNFVRVGSSKKQKLVNTPNTGTKLSTAPSLRMLF